MGIIDWCLNKIEQKAAMAKEARAVKALQEQAEKDAYAAAYGQARVEVVMKEAQLDAQYGGHMKRVFAEGLKNIKTRMADNKKKRAKLPAPLKFKKSTVYTPIEAKVK